MSRRDAAAQQRAYAEALQMQARAIGRALAPPIAAEFFAYEPFGAQGSDFVCRRLENRLRLLGATWFRATWISRLFDCPAYALGTYVEGWRQDPARMVPPRRPAPFQFPLTEPRVPFQSQPPVQETEATPPPVARRTPQADLFGGAV